MIRILLIDDHPIISKGIQEMFRGRRDGVCLTCHTDTVDNAIRKFGEDRFNLVLLDLFLGSNSDPIDNIRRIKEAYPHSPVVIFSTESREIWKIKTLSAGADGYIEKVADAREIKQVLSGITQAFAERKKNAESATGQSPDKISVTKSDLILSDGQLEILRLMRKGCQQKEIAVLMDMKLSGVEKSLRQMREKLRVGTTIELVVKCIKIGLLP
ncbi:MAG: hypothetical protein CVU06_14435 [Bacteroidetes bacterium HGW-Bacteroidetes-22]|nr:MAG: hypothetical protein CVU06_14435 [Bacteroidetes bacterium HGW-Bacteroidetes-22]